MTQKEIKNKWLNGTLLDGLFTFDEAIETVKNLEGQKIPNDDDWREFFENTEFYFDKEKKEGVFTFQDKTEIRLPAMGFISGNNGHLYSQGIGGYYQSSSVTSDGEYTSYVGFDDEDKLITDTSNRAYGYSVRCVKDEVISSIDKTKHEDIKQMINDMDEEYVLLQDYITDYVEWVKKNVGFELWEHFNVKEYVKSRSNGSMIGFIGDDMTVYPLNWDKEYYYCNDFNCFVKVTPIDITMKFAKSIPDIMEKGSYYIKNITEEIKSILECKKDLLNEK